MKFWPFLFKFVCDKITRRGTKSLPQSMIPIQELSSFSSWHTSCNRDIACEQAQRQISLESYSCCLGLWKWQPLKKTSLVLSYLNNEDLIQEFMKVERPLRLDEIWITGQFYCQLILKSITFFLFNGFYLLWLWLQFVYNIQYPSFKLQNWFNFFQMIK